VAPAHEQRPRDGFAHPGCIRQFIRDAGESNANQRDNASSGEKREDHCPEGEFGQQIHEAARRWKRKDKLGNRRDMVLS
jgi:hypothetical protein